MPFSAAHPKSTVMKIKAHKEKGEHKHKSSKKKSATEAEQLLPQKKLLSFTRTKDRKPRTSKSKQTTGPDLEDFRDLIDEDEEPVPEDGTHHVSRSYIIGMSYQE